VGICADCMHDSWRRQCTVQVETWVLAFAPPAIENNQGIQPCRPSLEQKSAAAVHSRRPQPLGLICVLLVAALVGRSSAAAQIYTCTKEDGSRVFSDSRCGPDAKVVPGIESKPRATAKKAAATPRPPRVQKTAAELEALIKKCDAGEVAACNEWTLGGGPNLLREKERTAELECEGGSLAACEERYCRDGVDNDCRARVLRTAKLAGETWYLRMEGSRKQDGSTPYGIRCIPPGAVEARDITVICSSQMGPNRCYVSDPRQGSYSRLDRAAAKHCGT
jgi:hypothetical protein